MASSAASRPPSRVAQGPSAHDRTRPDSLRVLKSQGGSLASGTTPVVRGRDPSESRLGQAGIAAYAYPQQYDGRHYTSPVVFLDMDLRVVRTNQAFQTLGFDGDLRNQNLEALVHPDDRSSLQNLRRQLRDERDTRDPAYLPPILNTGAREVDNIPPVETTDVQRITQGFNERPTFLRFRMLFGQMLQLLTSVRLARTNVFFVALVLPALPDNYVPPPPPPTTAAVSVFAQPRPAYGQSQQPAPTHFSPTFSAPVQPSAILSAPPSPFYTFQAIASSLPEAVSPTVAPPPRVSYEPAYFLQSSSSPYMHQQGTSSTGPYFTTGPSDPRSLQYQQPRMQLPPIPFANERVRYQRLDLDPRPEMQQGQGQERRWDEQAQRQQQLVDQQRARAPRPQGRSPAEGAEDRGKRRRLNLREVLER